MYETTAAFCSETESTTIAPLSLHPPAALHSPNRAGAPPAKKTAKKSMPGASSLDQTIIHGANRLRLALERAIGGRTRACRCSRAVGYAQRGRRWPPLAAVAAALGLAAVLSLQVHDAQAEPRSYFRVTTPAFKASVKLGHEMFVKFQCAKCHATHPGEILTKDIIAPNLILAKKRLRPEWMLSWLIDPQKLQPNTKMPNFFSFNEDDDFNPIYNDLTAHEQYKIIVALRDYTMVIGTEMDPDYDPDYDPVKAAEAKAAAAAAAEAAATPASESEAQEWEDYYGY